MVEAVDVFVLADVLEVLVFVAVDVVVVLVDVFVEVDVLVEVDFEGIPALGTVSVV